MFFVSDTQASRHDEIRTFLREEPIIAVLLAAADFEWTVRRAILQLGSAPTQVVRADLERCFGLDAYKGSWKEHVVPNHGRSLAQIVPEWQFFREHGYKLRNRVIHGVVGHAGGQYAVDRVTSVLTASTAVATFAADRGASVFGRIRVRR